ncbi:MAG: glycerol-3-phosphate acyltransferase [Fervidobacterium sp.]
MEFEIVKFLLIPLQFLSGSVMYSYILAKIAAVDLRNVRDGNPGSSNLWRVKGWKWGFTSLALDYFKGVYPLAFFVWHKDIATNPFIIATAALSGILGHAFSPFLKFKGGKAIATTFGAWSVLTRWEAPMLLGTVFTIFSIYNKLRRIKETTPEDDAVRVLFGFAVLFVYTLWKAFNGRLELLILYFGNLAVVLYKHKRELINITQRRYAE